MEKTMRIEGMMCGHCEAHMNDAIRNNFRVKKVTSDHKTGETVILTESDITDDELKKAIAPTGYAFIDTTRTEKEAGGGLFGFMKK